MPAFDTIACAQTTVNSTLAAGTMAAGDSATIRNAPVTAKPSLVWVGYDYVTTNLVFRMRSPALQDNIEGIQFWPAAIQGAEVGVSHWFLQPLQPQDTLTFEFSTAASTGKAEGVFGIYYPSVPGINARLHSWGDVAALGKNLHVLEVTMTASTNVANTWFDLVLTTTENILPANTDFAILGYTVDAGIAGVAVKGVDTGNLRVGGPGTATPRLTQDWFVRISQETGLPLIPVFNSANAGGSYVSVISSVQFTSALHVGLVIMELSQNLSN